MRLRCIVRSQTAGNNRTHLCPALKLQHNQQGSSTEDPRHARGHQSSRVCSVYLILRDTHQQRSQETLSTEWDPLGVPSVL